MKSIHYHACSAHSRSLGVLRSLQAPRVPNRFSANWDNDSIFQQAGQTNIIRGDDWSKNPDTCVAVLTRDGHTRRKKGGPIRAAEERHDENQKVRLPLN